MLPSSIAFKHSVVPLGHDVDGNLIIATSENSPIINDSLSFIVDEPYTLVMRPYEEIKRIQEEVYPEFQVSEPKIPFETSQPVHLDVFHEFIQDGIKQGASDIHIEAGSDQFCVRYRIHGELVLKDFYKKEYHELIVNHIKIIAHLSLDTKQKPQGGKFLYLLDGYNYSFRVSTLPAVHGECLVLRVHKCSKRLLELNELGLEDNHFTAIDNVIQSKNGLIVVCGSTGSGKTTTLYALMKHLRDQDLKVISIEDPVEASIEGVNQLSVDNNLDHESALRSILRQSPDVIMVGEIREAEVANIAFQASLTGHLVLTSIHANDASEAKLRFEEMGIEQNKLNDGLRLIIAQKLIKIKDQARVGQFLVTA